MFVTTVKKHMKPRDLSWKQILENSFLQNMLIDEMKSNTITKYMEIKFLHTYKAL